MEEITETTEKSTKEVDGSEIKMEIDTTNSKEIKVAEQKENKTTVSLDDSDDEDLRQFDVLDDLERPTNQEESDSDGCSNDSEDSDIPDDEIEAMLEEGLPDEFKNKRMDKRSDMLYEEREKLVLDEIGHNHFDVLPEGWVQVMILGLQFKN